MEVGENKEDLILEKLTNIEQLLTLLVNSQLEVTKQISEVGDKQFKLRTRVFAAKDLVLAMERKAINAALLPRSAEDIKV
jgi:hypothetical protein